ncbi:hypothetical protein AZE42_08033 [Rhizopogon vesiculosus]|uniref:Uncharacterized protein n=1 Tax=Rhizopogon vesiculosus TaxID=180088 RepID=A0A1J8QJC2_9AGAM|nr:hypothetical protein AZE42_08033 [Rhizopogon vesiculosus]
MSQGIKNAPLVGSAEGNGYFSNAQIAVLVIGVPWLLQRILPIVNRGGPKSYTFLPIITGIPVTVAYWTAASMYGRRKNVKVLFPGNDLEDDVLDILEERHDWTKIIMTPELFKCVFANLLEVIVHSQSQDEEQVRDHYDRPVIIMVLHYIVQRHRFNIPEDVACWPAAYNVIQAYFLVYM